MRLAWSLLRLASGAWHRLVRRLTRPAGAFAFAVLVVSAAAGVDTELTDAYQVFTFALALLVVAFAGAIAGTITLRGRFAVRRLLPPFATAGETVRYRVEIGNHARRASPAGLRVTERLVDPRPSFEDFANAPGGAVRRWRRLVGRRARVDLPDVDLPVLEPGESASLALEMVPRRRGSVRLDSIEIVRDDPLGLVRGFTTVPAPATLLVLPRRYAVPEIDLPGNRRFQPGGVSLATSVGDSEEFVGLRDYRPGDPLQRIHWKSFARAGKPVVREYQDEFFERHALVLDTFAAVEDEAFEEAVSLAASFAADIDTQESLLDLLFVGTEAYCYTAGRGQMQVETLLEVLAHVHARPEGDLEMLRRSVLARRPLMSGCILVLLAWDEARRRLVEALEETGLPVRVFLVSGQPAPEGSPVHLRVLAPGRIEEGLALT